MHRDFKPDNVLVGDDGRVRVSDFGLARRPPGAALASGPTGALGATMQGALVGTPAYMAPEQLRGAPADPRSDQFAFGVALFEALAGVRPFAGQTLSELAANVLAGRTIPELARRPAWQRAFFTRALAVDPAGRFASMEAALAELGKEKRSTARIVAGSVAAASAVAAIAVGVALSVRSPAPSRAAKPTATGAEARRIPLAEIAGLDPPSAGARAEVDAIRAALGDVDPNASSWNLGPVKTTVDDLVGRARAAGYDPVTAECLVALAKIESQLERPKRAKEALDEAVRLARASRYDALLFDATIELVRIAGVELGDAKEAETWIGLAEAEAKRRPEDRARRAALDLAIGQVRRRQGKLEDAAPLLDRAVALREAELGPDALEVADALVERSELELARGDAEGAKRDATRARDVAKALVVVRDGPAMVRFEVARGSALLAAGDTAAAGAALDEAIEIAKRYGHDRSPVALTAYDVRARLARAGAPTEARSDADRAAMGMLVEGADGKLTFSDPTGSGRSSGAIDFAAKIRGKVEKVDDVHHVSEENALACARAAEGDEPGALAALDRALAHADENPATVGGTLGALHYNRALLLARSGDLAAATAEIDLAKAFVEREVGADHVRVGLVELARARILRRLGSAAAKSVGRGAAKILAARRGPDDGLSAAGLAID
ncbi:MAG: serine/threonine-protein kinase [Polyangiaceae bacterium]